VVSGISSLHNTPHTSMTPKAVANSVFQKKTQEGLKKTVQTAQKEALRRFVTQIAEQEAEGMKIAQQASYLNSKFDHSKESVLR
jgi:hypothetical protein